MAKIKHLLKLTLHIAEIKLQQRKTKNVRNSSKIPQGNT